MKCLKRNKQKFWFCNEGKVPTICYDANGNLTGETITTYGEVQEMSANVSPATGVYRTEEFGSIENYDKVILTDDMNCQITEKTVLFVDKEPAFASVSTYIWTTDIQGRRRLLPFSLPVPTYDYVVWRVSKSLNQVAIAIKKVATGQSSAASSG